MPPAIYLPLSKCRELAAKLHSEYAKWYQSRMTRDLDDSTREYLSQCKTPEEMARFLPLGSIASNNDNKGFMLPCDLVDTRFYDDGELTHFNEDLRYVIMSGCFPRLGSALYREQVPEFMKFGHPDPDELLAFLTCDLQPI